MAFNNLLDRQHIDAKLVFDNSSIIGYVNIGKTHFFDNFLIWGGSFTFDEYIKKVNNKVATLEKNRTILDGSFYLSDENENHLVGLGEQTLNVELVFQNTKPTNSPPIFELFFDMEMGEHPLEISYAFKYSYIPDKFEKAILTDRNSIIICGGSILQSPTSVRLRIKNWNTYDRYMRFQKIEIINELQIEEKNIFNIEIEEHCSYTNSEFPKRDLIMQTKTIDGFFNEYSNNSLFSKTKDIFFLDIRYNSIEGVARFVVSEITKKQNTDLVEIKCVSLFDLLKNKKFIPSSHYTNVNLTKVLDNLQVEIRNYIYDKFNLYNLLSFAESNKINIDFNLSKNKDITYAEFLQKLAQSLSFKIISYQNVIGVIKRDNYVNENIIKYNELLEKPTITQSKITNNIKVEYADASDDKTYEYNKSYSKNGEELIITNKLIFSQEQAINVASNVYNFYLNHKKISFNIRYIQDIYVGNIVKLEIEPNIIIKVMIENITLSYNGAFRQKISGVIM